MNKEKWTERFRKIRGKLSFLSLSDNENLDDLFETEGKSRQDGSRPEEKQPDLDQPDKDEPAAGQQVESLQNENQADEGQQEEKQENENKPNENRQNENQQAEARKDESLQAESLEEENLQIEVRQVEIQQAESQPEEKHETESREEEKQQGKHHAEGQRHENRNDRAIQRYREPREPSAKELRRRRRINHIIFGGVVTAAIIGAVWAFYFYNQNHTFNDYVISKSVDSSTSSGTQYVSAGNYLYRYNSDGVTCVTRNNEVKWSITYSMQAPITDVCGTTMVIAEQQGTQVYVINEDGLMGSFSCLLPILKVRVSEQGVVAVVLKDDDVTWVRLYDSNGENIANDKTTISDSGYPLDIDLSPNGEKMVVSYLGIAEGVMTSNIVFYDFGSDIDNSQDHVISSESIPGSAVPQVYFKDNSTAAAIADDGFMIFTGDTFKKSAEYWFEDEIVSCFYDDSILGFLFADTTGENIYRMDLYNYRGKLQTSAGVDVNFDSIKVQNGRILMYTSSSCSVFTMKGKLQYSSAYEKEIVDMFYFSEYRRYLVITKESFDRIRIC